MTRTPLYLAALASSAVSGLDPALVEGVPVAQGDLYEIAYLQDSQDRRWVIKAPLTAAAGAMLDDVTTLCTLLGRRLDVAIPMVRGQAVVPEGRAVVYLRVPGRPLDFAQLPAGPGLASDLGRVLAHIHNVEHALFEEAGRPTYDAETHRRRLLSVLDRAAATGHVPTGLLARWEQALEDVSMWRFAPTPVHGTFSDVNVLASFDDESDAASGKVRAVLAWEESRIADPADDFAHLIDVAPEGALDAVLEAYAMSRVERPDVYLLRRARLAQEMRHVHRLLAALSAGDLALVEATAGVMRDLDDRAYDLAPISEKAPAAPEGQPADEPAFVDFDSDFDSDFDVERHGARHVTGGLPEEYERDADATDGRGAGPGRATSDHETMVVRPPTEQQWRDHDATAPHVAFGVEPDPDPAEPAGPDEPSEPVTGAAAGEEHRDEASAPEPERHDRQAEESQPVPVLPATVGDDLFEIDLDDDPLPRRLGSAPDEFDEDQASDGDDDDNGEDGDDDGVTDLHEGASEFIKVQRPTRRD